MNRDEVDAALARLHDVQQRIFASLHEVEKQFGYQLLQGATLTGETGRRWDETQSRLTALWRLYDAYLRTLQRADEVRARRNRLGDDDLAELATLLQGDSVEPEGAEIPLAHRRLLGPTIERMSIDVAVSRMDAAYSDVVGFVAEAEGVWNALQPRLDAADEAYNRLVALDQELPELAAAGRDVAALRESVRSDPLSVDPAGIDQVVDRLAALVATAEAAVRIRDTHDARVAEVRATIDALAAREDEARQMRAVVEEKIRTAGLPEIPVQSTGLRAALGGLTELSGRGQWVEFAARANELEAAVTTAGTTLDDTRDNIEGLLARRDELRGRLDAYQARSFRLGYAERADITGLYDAAHELLWTAPCDLRKATVALNVYLKALT